ncbi:MAG TPA: hypothetical protein VKH20_10665 [Solirubrobacterales bacterium]|nr:hypothetical protein [Solirubrobacterales bacterium]
MAYIVSSRKRKGTYEIRESSNTDKGPRSRTLVSFRELTDEVIEKAQEKAVKPASAEELRRAARRAGAPVARERVEQAARELIAELARGNRLDPTLRQILLEMLQRGYREDAATSPVGEAARSVALWMAATPADRGRALFDLLLLADALPSGSRRDKPLTFPRLDSTGGGDG